jgi:NADPH:quinone reductase-like Zn-dependent oxidoreductase
MMRAFAIPRYGVPPALLELPEPTGPEVSVQVRFAGVNPIDWKSIDGLSEDDKFPFVPGQDFAGVATHVEGEPGIARGDRVFGMALSYGSYADATLVPPLTAGEAVARIPDGLGYEEAAALPTAGLAALAALDVLRVERGTTLAIIGATGGVGSYATQIAKARGAHVVAVVRGDADDARALGADETIDASAGDPIAAIRRAHPHGITAILDLVSPPDTLAHDLDALVHGGRIVSTIHALDEQKVHKLGFEARNLNLREMPQASADGLTRLAEMVVEGIVRVRIAEVQPLANAADVLARGKRGQIRGGKALLRVRNG